MKLSNLSSTWQAFYNDLPPYCSRELIAQKSQVIERGTLANLDSLGKGIPNGRLVGKKTCYPKDDTVVWLMKYCGEDVSMLESDEADTSHQKYF